MFHLKKLYKAWLELIEILAYPRYDYPDKALKLLCFEDDCELKEELLVKAGIILIKHSIKNNADTKDTIKLIEKLFLKTQLNSNLRKYYNKLMELKNLLF